MKENLSRRRFLALTTVTAFGSLGLGAIGGARPRVRQALADRGYYLLPCRTPTLGYAVYRDLVDDLAGDQVNTLFLWLGGAFRSRKYP